MSAGDGVASVDRSAGSSAGRPAVVLLSPLGADQVDAIAAVADVLSAGRVDELPEPARRRCRVVVLRSGTRLGAAELALLPALTDVVRPGSGVDNIDVAMLAARGVTLHRNPEVSAGAVAELALTGLAALCRRIGLGYRWLLDGVYAKQRLVGEAVGDQTLAVWGAGPVGRAVHAEAVRQGLSSSFVAHPSVPAELPSVPVEEAFETATAHVLALPLRPATRGLVDPEWIGRAAARHPYLVNVGRYELMRLDAVADGLCRDLLAGCYLDPVDQGNIEELRGFLARTQDCNVLVTQHQGAQRADVRRRLDGWAADRSVRALSP